MSSDVPPPWDGFLRSVDRALPMPVDLHCLGGFAISMLYGLPRPTVDIDFMEVQPSDQSDYLLILAGKESKLAAKHGVYLQRVTVSNYPESYEQRLRPIFPGAYQRIRLFGLDPYDLALTKLERNNIRDRSDVSYLAHSIPLHPAVLRDRYEKEMRPYLARPKREDLTLKLWLEEYF